MIYGINGNKWAAALLCACSLLASGCVNEDLGLCPPLEKHTLTVKVLNERGQEITESGDVNDATLYIFDKDKRLIATRVLDRDFIRERKSIELPDTTSQQLYFSLWANMSGTNMDVADVKSGETADRLKVSLTAQQEDNELANEPGRIFYGNRQLKTVDRIDANYPTEVLTGQLEGNDTIVIQPKIAQVQMRTIGLQIYLDDMEHKGELPPGADANCDFFVNKTRRAYDYAGELMPEDSVYYNPTGCWGQDAPESVAEQWSGEWVTPEDYGMFRGEKMTAALDVFGVNVAETDKTDDGEPLTVPERGLLVVVFKFEKQPAGDVTVSVSAKVREWGYVEDNPTLEPVK